MTADQANGVRPDAGSDGQVLRSTRGADITVRVFFVVLGVVLGALLNYAYLT